MSDIIHPLPHQDEAELATLGALLIDMDSMETVSKLLRPFDFYRPAHRHIYDAMLALFNSGMSIDLITLVDELRANRGLWKAGGLSYVSRLTSAVPTSANVEYYARIVQAASIRRSLIRIGREIIEGAQDDRRVACDVLSEAKRSIDELEGTK